MSLVEIEELLKGAMGLDALEAVAARRARPAAWQQETDRLLTHASKPSAELELAVLPSIRKLVLAAARIETLSTAPADRWNALLDDELKRYAPPQEH